MSKKEEITQGEKLKMDGNVLGKLLELKDGIFFVEVSPEYFDRAVRVYYSLLKKGEVDTTGVKLPSTPEEYADMTVEDKKIFLDDTEAEYVFQMIDKAQATGDVPSKYMITRERWDELGEHFSSLRIELIGKITGGTRKMVEGFFGGRSNQHTRFK